ncbi:MAG: hypothetical protein WCI32_02415 [Actinomycetota bacterium]
MITAPPVDVGALHVKTTCAFPAVPVRLVGMPGIVLGVAVAVVDAAPSPFALTD